MFKGRKMISLSKASMANTNFHSMVVSGGSFRTICAIGCIQYLEEHDMMNTISTFVGTSAGSIISLFATLGMSSSQMTCFISEIIKKDYIKDLDINEMFSILKTYGLNSGCLIERFVSEVLTKTLGVGDITFLELAKQTGKHLVVCVANISKEREEFWSVDTTPSMSVIKAIRTSCSLPIVFTPVWHKGDMYVDGGLYNNFPINYVKNSNLADVIGIHIRSLQDNPVDSIFSYMNRLLTSTMNVACRKNTPTFLLDNVVSLEVQDHGLFSYDDMKLDLTDNIITEYLEKGYIEAKKQLCRLQNNAC